jgi:hypothetical protein
MVGRNDLCVYSSQFINANFYLCGRHFETNMFLSNLRTRLQSNAMPTGVNMLIVCVNMLIDCVFKLVYNYLNFEQLLYKCFKSCFKSNFTIISIVMFNE